MSEAEALEVAAVHSVSTRRLRCRRAGASGRSARRITALRRGAGRRRQRAAAGRNFARAPRRAVPRRAAGVRSRRARSAARAARDRAASRSRAPRARRSFPARFQLVAAMNPCPCGHLRRPQRPLPLHARSASRAIAAASPGRSPIASTSSSKCRRRAKPSSSRRSPARPRRRSQSASRRRARSAARAAGQAECAARHAARSTAIARTDREGGELLRHALARLLLSARAYHRVLRVARTIADLAGAGAIGAEHVAEAIQYRRLDASF